jgi:simple sugar transport system ATP-binding protein
MLNITKTFGPLVANDNITLQLKSGEIHAILGENGAGKSTLMSILFGLYKADSGQIRIRGKDVVIRNPNDANDYKIGMVHQHFKLVEVFSVLENIILGRENKKLGLLEMDKAREKVLDLSQKYNLHVDLDAKIKDISVGMQQRVEILKMLYRDADILIFDEPTAVLTPQEIEGLFQVIKDFAKEGKTVILITHKLNEIKSVADHCTILRKGKHIVTVDVKETSIEKMAEWMVGREVNFHVEKTDAKPGNPVLIVSHLNKWNKDKTKKILNDVSFSVRSGEIVCVAGIEGNGQTELVKAIAGLDSVHGGHDTQMILNGQNMLKMSIRKRLEVGMSHIPEDRQHHGLILDYTLMDNLISDEFYKKEFSVAGFLRRQYIKQYAAKLVAQYDVRSSLGIVSSARSMSGGNQQKAIIARETARGHNFLIAAQPTRGLDVGAIEYVHKTLVKERDSGKAILVMSLELDEVMNISDRILVMYEGEIVAELDPKKVTMEEMGLYMSGSKRQTREVTHGQN